VGEVKKPKRKQLRNASLRVVQNGKTGTTSAGERVPKRVRQKAGGTCKIDPSEIKK